MNVTALVALLIIVGLAILGFVRGLISSVWHLAGAIIIIFLTVVLAPTVAGFLNNNEKIHSGIYEKVEKTIHIEAPDGGTFNMDTIVERLNLPAAVEKIFKDSMKDDMEINTQSYISLFYEKVSGLIIKGIYYIITLIIVIIATVVIFCL
jgi:uncharacterized membrane protein required for colicin V production